MEKKKEKEGGGAAMPSIIAVICPIALIYMYPDSFMALETSEKTLSKIKVSLSETTSAALVREMGRKQPQVGSVNFGCPHHSQAGAQ